MAAVTVYLPEELAKAAKAKAHEKNESLSAYLAELVMRDTKRGWLPEFSKLLDSREQIEFEAPSDSKPEKIEGF